MFMALMRYSRTLIVFLTLEETAELFFQPGKEVEMLRAF